MVILELTACNMGLPSPQNRLEFIHIYRTGVGSTTENDESAGVAGKGENGETDVPY